MANGKRQTVNGLLLVDKPKGWTSHDVVAKVRSLLRPAYSTQPIAYSRKPRNAIRDKLGAGRLKVGHSGTLDPMATGLLIILVGSYTKRAGEFLKLDKTYEAELTLGATSTTGDAEGKISLQPIAVSLQPDKVKVAEVLKSFIGEGRQTPPQFSAIKIKGKKAYELARAGKPVKIEPRQVKIYEITDVKYAYPKLSFTTKVSSGTYIRSLAEDIGQKLGTGAYLSALRRLQVGRYNVSNAVSVKQATAAVVKRA